MTALPKKEITGKQKQENFKKDYEALCQKHGCRIVGQNIARRGDNGLWGMDLRLSIEAIPLEEGME